MNTARSLLIVALHAIFGRDGVWHGPARKGQEACYDEHLYTAVQLAKNFGYRCLTLSGGRTRPKLPLEERRFADWSEAEGAEHFLKVNAVDLGGVDLILETLALDSMQNLYLSILAYHNRYGEWPADVGLVSFNYKEMRFWAVAHALGLTERFTYYGCSGLGTTDVEDVVVKEAENLRLLFPDDPLHRGPSFIQKREGRMEPGLDDVKYLDLIRSAYSNSVTDSLGEVRRVIDNFDQRAADWRKPNWPW